MKEHREYIRLDRSLKVSYKVVDAAGDKEISFTEDISGGGLRLSLKRRVQPGAFLEVEIYLPEITKPIVVTGEVRWLDNKDDAEYPFVVGVKFAEIDQLDRGKLLKYIRERREEEITEN